MSHYFSFPAFPNMSKSAHFLEPPTDQQLPAMTRYLRGSRSVMLRPAQHRVLLGHMARTGHWLQKAIPCMQKGTQQHCFQFLYCLPSPLIWFPTGAQAISPLFLYTRLLKGTKSPSDVHVQLELGMHPLHVACWGRPFQLRVCACAKWRTRFLLSCLRPPF